MSRYGKIESGFWHSTKVRQLSERARYLLVYLFSCPHGNAAGCFVMPDGYISADLSWSNETVTETVSELSAKGFIERDKDSYLTRVVGWWGHNTIENRNVATHVVKEIKALPNSVVKQHAIDDLLSLTRLHETVMETLTKGLAQPFRNQEPIRTQPNPEHEPEPEPRSLETISSVSSKPQSEAAKLSIEIIKIYKELLPNEIKIPDTGHVDVWLNQGYSAPLIAAVVKDRLGKTRKFVPLTWFNNPMAEAHAIKAEPKIAGESDEQRFLRMLEHERKTGQWIFKTDKSEIPQRVKEIFERSLPAELPDIPPFLDRRAQA